MMRSRQKNVGSRTLSADMFEQGEGPSILSSLIIASLLIALVALFDSYAFAQNGEAKTRSTRGERGITGTYRFSHHGQSLQAKPQRSTDIPLSLRLTTASNDSHVYVARFLGNQEGVYDLRLLMEHVDGSEPSDLPPMPVEIVSMLPKDERSDLFESSTFKPKVWGGYRLSICLLGLLWLSVPVLVFIRRSMRPKPVARIEIEDSAPTIAEQLRPLVIAAAAKTISIRDKGRLELLLVHYWRERMELQSLDMATAIGRLRSHPEAGQLISAVERWLHQSESDADYPDHSPEAIFELLKPYHASEAIESPLSGVPVGSGAT